MEITKKIHRLRIDFKVTPEVKRFVYLYIILGKTIHLIDTGVSGTDSVIADYLHSIDRNIDEVTTILLTHSHPDHIGSANVIHQLTGCSVYGPTAEKIWIENIDQQFKERPIPNFYTLVNQSTPLTHIIDDGDILNLEEDIHIEILDTKGHSQGELSFYYQEEQALFTGDTVPVAGEIPIYVSAKNSIASLEKILNYKDVQWFLSAWDDIQNRKQAAEKISESLTFMKQIDTAIRKAYIQNDPADKEKIYEDACRLLDMKQAIGNPIFMLFKKSIFANIHEIEEV